MRPHLLDADPKRTAFEQDRLRERFRGLELVREALMGWVVRGKMPVLDARGFTVRLVVPAGYPHRAPALYPDPVEIPHVPARHVNGDGTACLCVRSETRQHWPLNSDLT